MKTSSSPLFAIALLLTPSALPAAAIIGVNFNNNDSAGSQNNGNFGATWTNVNSNPGASQAVSGTPSATLNWAASNYWNAGSWMSSNLGNAFNTPIGLMRVYLDDNDNPAAGGPITLGAVNGDGIGVSASLTGLSAWLASEGATGYTIQAFFSTDNGTAFQPISVRDGASVTSPILQTVTPTVQGNGTWNGTAQDAGGNDAGGIRGDALFSTPFTQDTITLTVLSNGGTSRGTLAGFILTAVPEPSVSLICGLGALGMMLQRRRK